MLIAKLGNGIVLLGADHTEKGQNNIFKNIKNKYSEVVSLVFIGGKNWSQDTEDYWIRKLEMDSQKNRNSNKIFILKVKIRFLKIGFHLRAASRILII